jgi:hypothetical protein
LKLKSSFKIEIDENLHFTVLPVSMKDSLSFWCFVFLLHCLIYKVQTALVGGALSYHTRFSLSSTFFSRFATRFTPQSGSRSLFPASVSALIQAALASANFVILTRRSRFVKNFFRLPQRLLPPSRLALAAPSGAQLIYQTQARLSTENPLFPAGFPAFPFVPSRPAFFDGSSCVK